MSSMQRRAAGSYVHRHEMLMCEHSDSFPLFPYDPVVPPSLRSRRRKGLGVGDREEGKKGRGHAG